MGRLIVEGLGSPRPVRLTLPAALVWSRAAEVTDSLADLLIAVVHGSPAGVARIA